MLQGLLPSTVFESNREHINGLETAFKTYRQNIALKGGSFYPAVEDPLNLT